MSFFQRIFSRQPRDETIVVDGEGSVSVGHQGRSFSSWFYFFSFVFLLVAIVLALVFTRNSLSDREGQWQSYFQLFEEKKTEQQNLEALKALATQIDVIRQDQLLLNQAIPSSPRYDELMNLLAFLIDEVRTVSFVQIPEVISWRPVSSHEVSNLDFQNIGIYEYSFSFLGEYEGLLSLLQAMRNRLRFIDVRSLRNLKFREDGLVSGDFSLWSYSLTL